jgi:hypothetical protein
VDVLSRYISRRGPPLTENLDAAAIRAWKARWKHVTDREIEELRALSIEDRLSHLVSLFRFRSGLGEDPFDEDEIERTRKRWNLLRRRARGSR